LGCLRRKQLGSQLLHVVEKMVFGASVKFSKTLGKHISLNIREREEKKDENQIQNTSIRLP